MRKQSPHQLHIFLPLSGQHQVIGATEPIVAAQGDDVIVPCYIDPPLNVEELTVDWWRPDVPPDPTDPPDKYRYVHRYHDKNNVEDMKMSSYSGRTAIFKDELRKGNVSLKIVNVKLSDQGRYRCAVPQLGSATSKEHFIELVVGAFSPPSTTLAGLDRSSSGVVLQCESKGWYPEPELLWLDAEGKILSAGPTETVRGPDDLYTVSSRVTVEKRHSNNITCRVQERNINQTRETQMHVPGGNCYNYTVVFSCLVPDDFFIVSSCTAATTMSVLFGLLFTLTVVLFVWKWRQDKLSELKHYLTYSIIPN
uniref:Ig-like domain-containing protein n=1 Tax=Anabas testudineus TaxID=64144 RepID=A0A7N6B5Z8_ANATE